MIKFLLGRWTVKPALRQVMDTVHRVTARGIYRARDGQRYIIPGGFEADGGSVPRLLWWWMPPFGDRAQAAYLLHDYLYNEAEQFPGMTRKIADDLLHEAAIADGMPSLRAYLIWCAVRLFGGRAWEEYRQEAIPPMSAA